MPSQLLGHNYQISILPRTSSLSTSSAATRIGAKGLRQSLSCILVLDDVGTVEGFFQAAVMFTGAKMQSKP